MKENPYQHMDEGAYRVAYLIAGFIRNTLTEEERDELDDWITASDENMKLFEDLTDENNLEANMAWMDKVQSEKKYMQRHEDGAFKKPARRFSIRKVWLAAASVVLIAGAYIIYQYATKGMSINVPPVSDISTLQPGGNKATLTLESGAVIDLTSAKNGLINADSSIVIIKVQDGKMVYDDDSLLGKAAVMHTLATPVGGQFQVRLPDGTNAWLNASSSLKYPSRFSGRERKVEVEGEVYFEVAKNETQPFIVALSDSSYITVTGTHFNVMAYENEQSKLITLLEGAVTVTKGNKSDKLSSGMQEKISGNQLSNTTAINAEKVIGWKDGLFVFHDEPIQAIMRQVERWYGAKVIYQGEIKQLFNATIERKESLSKLLHLLELNGYVHFKTENKTIYVLP